MKLMLCIIQDQDAPAVLDGLRQSGLSATKLASTGGFLRQGNTTLVLGVNETQVDEVLAILKNSCRPRGAAASNPGNQAWGTAPSEAGTDGNRPTGERPRRVGGAIVFVLNVARFDRV
ncbi:MAG: cyclic-di-AMP receptor [Limnochordaceae bacterium]|nr:cyclic-di-AMP receptor [Limnochordaceae bacterium]